MLSTDCRKCPVDGLEDLGLLQQTPQTYLNLNQICQQLYHLVRQTHLKQQILPLGAKVSKPRITLLTGMD